METITVLPQGPDGRVAIWDRDPAHGDSDLFLTAGQPAVTIALTSGVRQAIRDGRLLVLAAPPEPVAESPKPRKGKKAESPPDTPPDPAALPDGVASGDDQDDGAEA